MNTTKKIIIFLLSVIIILIIIYLFNKHNTYSLQNSKEGFISQYYRPYYRKIKRGISGYLKNILHP